MNLFFRESGKGTPLIVLHGLFGSSDNWYSLSKIFAEHFRVYALDQRNHGQSPHDPAHNYKALTADLEAFAASHQIQKPVILGHSMGGKVAMNFAIKNPGSLRKLIVVDIMPKPYPLHHDHILEGLKSIDLKTLASRAEADQILKRTIAEPDVRQFLLKNLSRAGNDGFAWKINLPVLEKNIGAMSEGLQYNGKFPGPTLFIKGSKSNYYSPGDETSVQQFFPGLKWITLDTGHWVQSEKTKEFGETVLKFLEEK